MIKIINNFNWIIAWSLLCIFFGILTFLTYINISFIPLSDQNLQILLIVDVVFLLIFFNLIFKNIYKIYIENKKNKIGSETNIRYITLFSLFTLVPSLVVAIFSLLIFNYGVQNYFDDQIKSAVSNSYDVAKSYLDDNKKNIKSDVILMSVGLNRSSEFFYSNPNRFSAVIRAEKILRRIDDIYLIDSTGNILLSDSNQTKNFTIPSEENYDVALTGNPAFVSNTEANKTVALMKLNTLVDTYLYISRNIDPNTIKYLNETEQAVSFYYSIENKQTGIKITFAIIYIILVTLLLFLSTILAISFASRLTKPIINLIAASKDISKGLLETKVPEIESDKEFMMLNKNFNNMIERLRKQQDKLLISERHEAWETVARKLAHEIKNPLTPIQLSIDRLRDKYAKTLNQKDKNFEGYLKTINRQIKEIEKLVNEFSNFARMPRPIFKKINLFELINKTVSFIKISSKFKINLVSFSKKIFVNADEGQLNRVFINLLKNSEEAITEKIGEIPNYKGKIDIEIDEDNDYIVVKLTDNGIGVPNTKQIMTPYFTTKREGTGLGLPIVSKIISEHSGEFTIKKNNESGINIKISLLKINE